MATKTLTFKFIKKAKFKLSKDNYVNKTGKKKVLGLQAMSIMAGSPYHLAQYWHEYLHHQMLNNVPLFNRQF